MFSSSISASLPLSKSSLAASLGRLVEEGNIKKTLLFPITKLESYEICLIKEKTELHSLALLGTIALNIGGLFTGTDIPYPFHHFLIATAEDTSIYKNEFKRKMNEAMKQYTEELKKKEEDPNSSPSEKMEARMKMSFSPLAIMLNAGLSNITNKGRVYYLIEKGDKGKKIIKPFLTNIEIFNEIQKTYNNNKVKPLKKFEVNKKLTIEDIHEYISTLPDTYNLIDDNCQDFVKNILDHYEPYLKLLF